MDLRLFQFGLPINDAFTLVLLFESVNQATEITLSVEILAAAIKWGAAVMPWWVWVIWLIFMVQVILWISLIWTGFVSKGVNWTLRIWSIIAGVITIILHLVALIGLCTSNTHNGQKPSTGAIFLNILTTITSLTFRSYVIFIILLTWKDVTEGIDLKGFTQGVLQLFQHYKTEFQRLANIFLVYNILWNIYIVFAADLPLELGEGIPRWAEDGSLLPRPVIALRVTCLVVAIGGLYLLKKGKMWWLKWVWLPCQILGIIFALVVLLYVTALANNPKDHSESVPSYCMEAVFGAVINILLTHSVIQLVLRTEVTPTSMVNQVSNP